MFSLLNDQVKLSRYKYQIMSAQYAVTLFGVFAQLIQLTDERFSQSPNIPPSPLSQLVEVSVGSSVQLQCNLSSLQSKDLIWWHNDKTVYNGQDGSLDKRFSVLIKPNQQFLVFDEATENYVGDYKAETEGDVLIQYHLVVNAAGSPRPTASVLDDTTGTHQPLSTTQQQRPEISSNQQSVTYGGYGYLWSYYGNVLNTICALILVYLFAEKVMKKYRRHTAAMPHTEQETSQDKHQISKPGTETSNPTTGSQAVDEDAGETDNYMNLHRAEQVALTGVIAER